MNLTSYRESTDKQNGGVPIYIEDATFICRRWGTEASDKMVRDITIGLFGPLHNRQEGDFNLIFAHWLVEYGIVNWENVTDGQDPVPYSQFNCRRIFLNPEMFLSINKILFQDVNNFEHYLHDALNQDVEDIQKQ